VLQVCGEFGGCGTVGFTEEEGDFFKKKSRSLCQANITISKHKK